MGYSPWGHKESDMAEQLILLLTDASGFPESSIGKESVRYVGDPSLIPGLGRYSREGNGNGLQYSCLGNPTDRGAWWATVYGGLEESDTI